MTDGEAVAPCRSGEDQERVDLAARDGDRPHKGIGWRADLWRRNVAPLDDARCGAGELPHEQIIVLEFHSGQSLPL
jgi:hypothetical protein